jgi:tetratricopeptide (TPR) repeat protein
MNELHYPLAANPASTAVLRIIITRDPPVAMVFRHMLITKYLSRISKSLGADSEAGRASELQALIQAGFQNQQRGDESAAQQSFQRALLLSPSNADAHYLLGVMLGKRGELRDAEDHLRQAIAGNPGFSDAHAALGNVRLMQGDKDGALASYQRAVSLAPDSPEVHSNLGLLYQSIGMPEQALQAFRLAYRLAPQLSDILRNLTLTHVELGQYESALAVLDPLLDVHAHRAEALKYKGFVLQKMLKPDQALICYEQIPARGSTDPELLNNLGIVLQDLGRLSQAIEYYDEAISLQPDFPLAIWHRSLAYLMQHDFARGWDDYELRRLSIDQPKRPKTYPPWDGRSLEDRGILVYAEQGLGDEIMFASCLPDVINASRRCVIECSPKLETLFQRSFPAATVYATPARPDAPSGAPVTGIDMQSGIGSLPRFLRRTRADFPQHGGYLIADPQSVRQWKQRLAALGPGANVGISWRGGMMKTRRKMRSLSLLEWLPILKTPQVHFVNLQYDDCQGDLDELESIADIKVTHWQDAHDDYGQTAALVSALDLVISVCTAVIHLSGALGRPVWIMAPYSPEWRYGFSGESMPWYPAARVFRQPEYGRWAPVVERVACELAEVTAHQHHE